MAIFTRPEEVMDYLHDKLEDNKITLGIKYIGYGDEDLIPEYPAVLVTADPVNREIHATHTFRNFFNLSLWVYHADMSVTRKVRNREDLLLCSAIYRLIHDDLTLGGNIIFGYIDSEVPGVIRNRRRGAAVGTRMTYLGEARERFTGEGA